MEKIIGLIDAPFTPFYANGDVNLEPIEAYAKMLQHVTLTHRSWVFGASVQWLLHSHISVASRNW